jgi:hypothetical protein
MRANADLEIPTHAELAEILERRLKEVDMCAPDDFVLGGNSTSSGEASRRRSGVQGSRT